MFYSDPRTGFAGPAGYEHSQRPLRVQTPDPGPHTLSDVKDHFDRLGTFLGWISQDHVDGCECPVCLMCENARLGSGLATEAMEAQERILQRKDGA